MGFAGSKCQPGNPGERPLDQNLENENSEKILFIPENKREEALKELPEKLIRIIKPTNNLQE